MKSTIKLIDYAILGLLRQEAMSGYQIRKIFEETAMGNYSSSPGTIYPALKRLQKLELVLNTLPDTRNKTKFIISKKGLTALKQWLQQTVTAKEVARKQNELFLRFAFMGQLINRKKQLKFLQEFHDLLQDYIVELQTFHKANFDTLPLHGRLAFEHGLVSNKTTLKWCKSSLVHLSKN